MRIIGIEGLWRKTRNPIWINLEAAFRLEFSPEGFVIEEQRRLGLTHVRRIRELEDRVVDTHDDGSELLLLGHSFGGIIACRVSDRFVRSRVLGIVTIFSPHRLPLRVIDRRHVREPDAPIVSFGGRRDYVVPYFLTVHPRAVKHILLPVNHWQHVAGDAEYAVSIASESRRLLFPTT